MRAQPALAAIRGHVLRVGGSALLAAALVLGLGSGVGADVRYTEIDAGDAHTCAVRASGTIACWGDNTFGQASPPGGSFSTVSAGGGHTCAVAKNNTVVCWGLNNAGQTNAPGDRFRSISAGLRHTCGVKLEDSTVACWGDNSAGQAAPPAGAFRFVSAGLEHTCASRGNSEIVCWGDNSFGQASPPPPGRFPFFSAGRHHTCGVRGDGGIVCWGDNSLGQASPPQGQFRGLLISAGGGHTCVLKAVENFIACWGDNSDGQATPPPAVARFATVSAGQHHTCGISAGQIFCWGSNADGRATPPGDNPAGPPGDNRPQVKIVAQGCSPCRPGDVLRIFLNFSNPGPERTVELIAIAHSPDGKTMYSFLNQDLQVTLPSGQSTTELAPVTIPAGLTTGAFHLEAALLNQATGDTLSRTLVVRELLP